MAVFQETRTTVRQQIGLASGRLVQPGTFAVSSGTPGLVRAEDLFLRDADIGRGYYLYIPSGGGSGQARTVISATAGMQGTGSLLYPHLNFSPAPSTNAVLELWRGVDPRVVNGFIDDAIRAASMKVLQPKEDYAIILGDQLGHLGTFERWPSGGTAYPDGWSLLSGAGTVTRSSILYSGRYSMALTNTADNGQIVWSNSVHDWPSLIGKQVTVKAKVFATTAARVRIGITDGVATQNSVNHDGVSGWDGNGGQTLEATITVAGGATGLRVEAEILTGDSITAYFGKFWLEGAGTRYEFDLPSAVAPATADETSFVAISDVSAESLTAKGSFTTRIPPEAYHIDGDSSTRRIVFHKGLIDQFIVPGRELRITGQRAARLPASDSQNIEVDPEYVRRAAMYAILDANPWDDDERSKRDRWKRDADALLQDITTRYAPDSLLVEAW